jgi:hypothetical protein
MVNRQNSIGDNGIIDPINVKALFKDSISHVTLNMFQILIPAISALKKMNSLRNIIKFVLNLSTNPHFSVTVKGLSCQIINKNKTFNVINFHNNRINKRNKCATPTMGIYL